jgi:hypothetical protein
MTGYAKKTDTVSFLAPIPQKSQLDAVVFDAVHVYYNLDATRGGLHSPGAFSACVLL